MMGECYDIAVKEISKLGFNTETIQLTEAVIQNMIKNFENNPEMSNLLHKVINSKAGVLFQRCHMTSVVASEMIKNLNFSKVDPLAFDKITYASFFHDIMLAENEKLSKINTFNQLENAELSEDDWDLVFNHAFEASVLIRKYPNAPSGIDEIIKHHHGAINGKGFSLSLEKLPDLSKIFIIAHHFVLELICFKETGAAPKPIIEELYHLYKGPEITLIIKALETTLRKKSL
jgi:HD-GYP domain-containing protein (c-di-GMP phosphodiesterase class II)